MSVKQFNVSYLPNDDRIIFRFNTIDNNEYIFWLTRRVTHFILMSANQFIEKEYEKLTPSVENVISEMHKSDTQEASFSRTYTGGAQYPIGGDAVLVIDVKCKMIKIEEQDIFSLDLVLPGGGNLNIRLAVPVMKMLILLLEELNIQAKWGNPVE